MACQNSASCLVTPFCAVSDFMTESATISEEENCTTISTREDNVIERNKVFGVTLHPLVQPDSDSDDDIENQRNTETSFTVILEDNDSEKRESNLCSYAA